jgi:hypothetical protein
VNSPICRFHSDDLTLQRSPTDLRRGDGREETDQTLSMLPQNFLQPLRHPFWLVLQPSEQEDADGFLPFPKDKVAKILNIASDEKTTVLNTPSEHSAIGGLRWEHFSHPNHFVACFSEG